MGVVRNYFKGMVSVALAGMICLLCVHAVAAYPERSVRLVIPYPPGGAGDIVGRMLSIKLVELLGQQMVIDNRPGGAQVIATQLVARAPADGYTLFLASATHGINPGLIGKLPYDSIRDFAPITIVADSPLIFAAHPSLNVSTIQELVAAAKVRPGRINYASSGPGTGGHLSNELLKWMARIDMVHVPYKGAAPALVDVLGGQVPLICTSPLAALPHVMSGRLRGLAMTSLKRSRAAPDIPTVAESGFPGYASSLWYAMLAPARTPPQIIKRLHGDTVKILKSTDVMEQLLKQGADPIANTPQEAEKFLRSEIERWTKVILEAKISGE